MTSYKRYCDYTNYPKIYKKVYWGGFDVEDNSKLDSDIFDNRNKFVQDYNVRNIGSCQSIDVFISLGMNKGLYRKMFDHVEVYKTNDSKYIIVVSPYSHVRGETLTKFKERLDFTEIYNLYHKDAITMIKIVDNLKKLRTDTNYSMFLLQSNGV
jgi:hypothetical protein